MKLSDWAEQQGITYKTAWRWFKTGRLPVPCTQTPTGTVIVHVEAYGSVLALALRLPKPDRKLLISELEKTV
jgi:predicted site-specific integrase-resolvase